MILIPRFIKDSIQNKLFVSFQVVLLLLIAIVLASFIVISQLGKASEKILKMNYNSIITSMRMIDELESIHRGHILCTSDPSPVNTSLLITAKSNFSQWLGRAKDNITEHGEEETLQKIESDYGQYLVAMDTCKLRDNAENDATSRIELLRNEIRRNCLYLLKINQDAMFVKSASAQEVAKQGKLTLLLVTIAVFIFGSGLSWGLSRHIVSPILKLKEATQKIGRGDYDFDLQGESDDELGILTQEFRNMTSKVRSFNDLNIRKIVAEQQKIEAIFANIRDGIILIGVDYKVLDANPPSLEAFRLKRSEVIGHHFLEIVKLDCLYNDLKTCLEKRQQVISNQAEQVIVITIDQRQHYLEYSFSPVLTNSSELLGALLLLRDVTTLKELDKLKSEFVMVASHELKTPLTSINMSIDLLRESLGSNPKPGDMELISIAKEDINRLRSLVSDLLDLSKLDTGKIDMHFRSVDPSVLLNTVSQYFKNQLTEKHASIEIELPKGITYIWCDEEKLMLVFSNLISNAIKAISQEGKIRLLAEVTGKYVLFSVIDDGNGIPLQYQNKIFDRFVQVEDQNSARGTGLGLTISREIVRAHGGSIWVESIPGQGATFCFTIPIEPNHLSRA